MDHMKGAAEEVAQNESTPGNEICAERRILISVKPVVIIMADQRAN
jgi:hypothetical protein